MDRIYPVRRDRLLHIDIPVITSVDDVPEVIAAIIFGICIGELSLEEGIKLAGLVELYARAKLGCIRHDVGAECLAIGEFADERFPYKHGGALYTDPP
jgi:hypothetical protein